MKEKKRVNKRARFYKKRITCSLIPKYIAELNIIKNLNLKIDTTKYI